MDTTVTDLPNGIGLARRYWASVVRPLMDAHFPGTIRAAARVGTGSDVLGLDDPMSRDHDWGLRLQVFVPADRIGPVRDMLLAELPPEFLGLPTSFAFTGQAAPTLAMDVLDVCEFAAHHLGFDPRGQAPVQRWLSVTGQAALQVAGGEVFEDLGTGLAELREALTWYPDDIWRYVVATDWQRLDQELPLMSRAADRGDENGARVIAARLADIAVHLAFTLARAWCPYSKWRGLLLGRLTGGNPIADGVTRVLDANEWRGRQRALGELLGLLLERQAAAGLPTTASATVPFWDRPYLQVNQDLVDVVTVSIQDPAIRALPRGLGSAEQRTDNVDLLVDPAARLRLVGA